MSEAIRPDQGGEGVRFVPRIVEAEPQPVLDDYDTIVMQQLSARPLRQLSRPEITQLIDSLFLDVSASRVKAMVIIALDKLLALGLVTQFGDARPRYQWGVHKVARQPIKSAPAIDEIVTEFTDEPIEILPPVTLPPLPPPPPSLPVEAELIDDSDDVVVDPGVSADRMYSWRSHSPVKTGGSLIVRDRNGRRHLPIEKLKLPKLPCAADPELFFAERTRGRLKKGETQRPVPEEDIIAKRLCGGCAIRQTCLLDAIARREKDGIWGGMDEDERAVYASANGL